MYIYLFHGDWVEIMDDYRSQAIELLPKLKHFGNTIDLFFPVCSLGEGMLYFRLNIMC